MLWATSYTTCSPISRSGRPSTFVNDSRTQWVIICRLAHAKLAAQHMARKYSWPSGEEKGAHASCRSGRLMPYFFRARSATRR
ncbi:hypothetical protein HRbin32_00901 [bacterium HR32]|nr:hypothetical protein HRbin32_00901 [bacterium HR32]